MTITIDERKMYNQLKSELKEKYTLAATCYNDEIPASVIQECLDQKDTFPMYEKDYWGESRDQNAWDVMQEMLKKKDYREEETELFLTTDEAWEIHEDIVERDESDPEDTALKNTIAHAYIRFHSNYDCAIPLWEQGGLYANGTALSALMSALSLNPKKVRDAARKRDIQTFGSWRNVASREGKEVVAYDDFINVIIETPCYGNWSFFGKLDMHDLSEAGFDDEKMTIPKGTSCCFYNWWNGSGSLDFCDTIRDISVKELRRRLRRHSQYDDLKTVIDEKENKEYNWTPCDTYGGHISENILLRF